MLKVLSLFSGIGGFDLGLERAGGFQTVVFYEIDPFCRRVLAKHWPGMPIINDVRGAEFPDADVIVGGFPCQDVSRAGKRARLAGARSGLYRELVRAVRMVRPSHAIVENVAALVGDGLDAILGDLAESGYNAEWDCVPAGSLGAPHERDRVWIVAHATDAECLQGGERHDATGIGRRENEAGQAGLGADVAPFDPNSINGWRGAGRQDGSQTGDGIESPSNPARPHDRRSDGSAAVGQEPEPGNCAGQDALTDAPGIRCREGRTRRPPDSFAWIRNATRRHAANAYGTGLPLRESEPGDAREERQAAERAAFGDVWQSRWPCEPALLGMDDGLPDRVDRTRCLGNALIPQIPELIGRASLAAEGGA